MFLLILIGGLNVLNTTNFFKFHYVSINSRQTVRCLLLKKTLNSIMFLLIPLKDSGNSTRINAVNSIMFLLIRLWHFLLHPLHRTLNSIMFLLIPVPKPTAYLLHETPLFCRPLQNISFLSHSSSCVLATPPILAIFYFCRFPTFFTLSQIDRNHYIFIISSFLLA